MMFVGVQFFLREVNTKYAISIMFVGVHDLFREVMNAETFTNYLEFNIAFTFTSMFWAILVTKFEGIPI